MAVEVRGTAERWSALIRGSIARLTRCYYVASKACIMRSSPPHPSIQLLPLVQLWLLLAEMASGCVSRSMVG